MNSMKTYSLCGNCPSDCSNRMNTADDYYEVVKTGENGHTSRRSTRIALAFLTEGEIEISINGNKIKKLWRKNFS
ncbi:MAG: hypothetical protein LBR64_05895 [Dysgonamonadaceae bacterium]|nr:hypothetical protein [Dysgonamonadaceae bacterium]